MLTANKVPLIRSHSADVLKAKPVARRTAEQPVSQAASIGESPTTNIREIQKNIIRHPTPWKRGIWWLVTTELVCVIIPFP